MQYVDLKMTESMLHTRMQYAYLQRCHICSIAYGLDMPVMQQGRSHMIGGGSTPMRASTASTRIIFHGLDLPCCMTGMSTPFRGHASAYCRYAYCIRVCSIDSVIFRSTYCICLPCSA